MRAVRVVVSGPVGLEVHGGERRLRVVQRAQHKALRLRLDEELVAHVRQKLHRSRESSDVLLRHHREQLHGSGARLGRKLAEERTKALVVPHTLLLLFAF